MFIEKPTIADLIRALSEFPAGTPVRIEDADTHWIVETIHFEIADGKLYLYGEYDEMVRD